MQTLDQRLAFALHQKGKLPVSLARACGVTSSSVTQWMTGATCVPRTRGDEQVNNDCGKTGMVCQPEPPGGSTCQPLNITHEDPAPSNSHLQLCLNRYYQTKSNDIYEKCQAIANALIESPP